MSLVEGIEILLAEKEADESFALEDDKFSSLARAMPRVALTARACGLGRRLDGFLPPDSSERNLRQSASLNSCADCDR